MAGRKTASERSTDWVSKADLVSYVHCPYAFWLLDQGQISFEDTVDEFQIRLLLEGAEFQRLVEAAAVRVDVEPENIPGLLRQEILLLGVPPFKNHKLKIFGQPDGIDAAGGALFPIEIKSHMDVQRTDELELAFYWLLLEPHRTRRVRDPRGYLILRREGQPEQVEVPIRPQRFADVRRLIEAVRVARHRGVVPRICACTVCSRVRREEVHRITRKRKDLTLIFGVGPAYAPALEEIGLGTWEDLLSCESRAIVQRMRERNYFVSVDEVERWKWHAKSWKVEEPVYFGDALDLGDSFIALDLEYVQDGPLIWLVGACIVNGDRREYVALWANAAGEEKRNLQQLMGTIAGYPTLPVLTWSGEGADVSELRKAAGRLRVTGLDSLVARHLDLYLHARRSVRLPIPRFSLKDVAEYFGIARISQVKDGLQAQLMYLEYRRCQDRRRKDKLRDQLLEYNRDDLDALAGTAQRIREISLLRSR